LNFGRTIVDDLLDPAISPYFEVVALCDQDESTLQNVCPNKQLVRYCHLDELLADDQVEAIGLFTGPIRRAELIRKIIRAGRHVITTKPLELDPEAMLHVLKEARKLGRIVHSNSPGPLPTPDLKVIQQWSRQYELGRQVGAHADVWSSYREAADGTWYDDPLRCPAAPIYRLGIYLVNDLVRLFGKIERVHLMESRIFTNRPTADNCHLSLLFENKAIASLYASFCVGDGDQYRNGLTLNYENGTIYRNTGPAWAGAGSGHSHLALVTRHLGQPQVIARAEVAHSSGSYQWDYFHRAIRGERDPEELSPEEMVEGIRAIQAMSAPGVKSS